jgi:hypothetical protein
MALRLPSLSIEVVNADINHGLVAAAVVPYLLAATNLTRSAIADAATCTN